MFMCCDLNSAITLVAIYCPGITCGFLIYFRLFHWRTSLDQSHRTNTAQYRGLLLGILTILNASSKISESVSHHQCFVVSTLWGKKCATLFLQLLCQSVLKLKSYWHIHTPLNLEQNDIKISNLSWGIRLQCFVKRSMRARVCYQRHVSLNVIIIVSNI